MMTAAEWGRRYRDEYSMRMFGTTDLEQLSEDQLEQLRYELDLEYHFYKEDHI